MMRSLVELSQKVLIRHLDSIREFGDIPTHLVVPILAAANANQVLRRRS